MLHMTEDYQKEFEKANNFSLEFYTQLISTTDNEDAIVAQSNMSHLRRFNKMLDLGNFDGKSILDIGCGLGGFNKFLIQKGIHADYYGIDIHPEMVELAKKKNPEIADHFEVFDIITSDYHRSFDYCIAIGILNLNFGANINDEMNFTLMKQMAKFTNIGFAVSMTSNLSPKPTPDTYYFDAAHVLRQANTITRNYKLDHSYLPNDFTIFCYMEDFFKQP
jgi:SAM-dependent methyltransferase